MTGKEALESCSSFYFITCTGCPSEDIPQLAENGSKSETGTSATGEGTTALNEGRPWRRYFY